MVNIEVHSVVNNTPHIRAFKSYMELLKTANFQGELRAWWKDSVVRFYDGKKCSCSMVEIIDGRTITIGLPAHYISINLNSYKKALRIADRIAQDWLEWEDKNDFKKFVNQIDFSNYDNP